MASKASEDFLSDKGYLDFAMLADVLAEFLMNMSTGLISAIALYGLFGFVGYLLLCHFQKIQPKRKKRVIFIVAHPDDEVMFFGPTIMRLREACDIYLICLSDGEWPL